MVRALVVLVICWPLFASAQSIGAVTQTQWVEQQLSVTTDQGVWTLAVVDTHIVKVSFLLGGEERPNISKAVVPDIGREIEIDLKDKKRRKTLAWGDYALTYHARSGTLSLEKDGHRVAQALGFEDEDSLEVLAFELAEGERLYGGGFRALPMNRVGYRLPLYNAPQYGYGFGWEGSNFSIPTFVSSMGYAIFLDNPAKGWADLGVEEPEQYRFEMVGGPMTFYWVLGDTPSEIIQHYTQLTGRQPMPPKWALGNFASRFGYRTEVEARAVVDSFLKDSIPLDAIIIDLYWFGKGVHDSFSMGNLRWDREAWPNPEGMIADFAEKDIKTILIAEPFIMQESYNFDNAVALGLLATDSLGESFVIEDFWFGPTGLLDLFKPAAREWFWEQYDRQIKKGVAGWWGDLGEPEKHPSDVYHVTGPADKVHNAYGHWWSELLFTQYQQHYPKKRLFHLNRSGFAGSPRYAGYPWSGDVGRNWSGFKAQLPIMLGMAWCGVPYMHSDLGGFAMGDEDPELYTRWLQMGVFNPIYRPHAGGDIPAEPVFWADTTKARAKAAIEWRYQLLPYNYNLTWEAEQYGWPLARPMAFYSDAPELQTTFEQYFWGKDILVAPVIEQGAKEKSVLFPKGNNWVHWLTGNTYAGGTTATLSVNLDGIPVFMREGAIIPMRPKFSNIDQLYEAVWEWQVFLDEDNQATTSLYQDDGHTPGTFSKGAYFQKHIRVAYGQEAAQLVLEVTHDGPMRGSVLEMEQAKLVIRGLMEPPTTLVVNGRTPEIINWSLPDTTAENAVAIWDDTNKLATLTIGWINR